MTTSSSSPEIRYGEKVLQVEPYGAEAVAQADRHGKPRTQFTLWLGSNLTIADFALGFLPISMGMSWAWTIAAVVVGNLLGATVLAACAAMGPTYGTPQLIIGRFTFGRVGGYLPAVLNYLSTIGWFAVNNILGTFGLQVLFPHLAFWQGALILVFIQGLLAVYGHNLIHTYERIMAVVLGVLFLIATVIALSHHQALAAYRGGHGSPWVLFAVMVAASFSYIGSWGPYASDYSRYLRPSTSKARVFGFAFLGSFVASVWLELVGGAVAVLAASQNGNPISDLHQVMGGFGAIATIAIILGGTAADALNLYSNSLSAGAMDIRLPRWSLAVTAGLIGLILSLSGSGAFEQNYENFLLMLGYWIMPWLGVLFTDFYFLKRYRAAESDRRMQRTILWSGLVSFVVGFVVSIPFMSGPLYKGPIASALGGADLSFYISFLVSALLYMVLERTSSSHTALHH
ncbi:cytosine permease [Alicyclobacillus sp. SO9]|uniref:purine-cytosine permease family protein n=1 Tax=Alicyclobacillus sp. SO9 TaxID=2665646 RepID=UPI0018E79AE9|nr:cytosine permease [Alicyclobacillus sp. SO9]QQE77778.1 cytosine permease [Alicyclobacillus sp. SO9]